VLRLVLVFPHFLNVLLREIASLMLTVEVRALLFATRDTQERFKPSAHSLSGLVMARVALLLAPVFLPSSIPRRVIVLRTRAAATNVLLFAFQD